MSVVDIIKLIGSIAAIIGTIYAITNSKRFIIRRIERLRRQVGRIDHEIILRYGLNRGTCHPITELDSRRERLNNKINELSRYL